MYTVCALFFLHYSNLLVGFCLSVFFPVGLCPGVFFTSGVMSWIPVDYSNLIICCHTALVKCGSWACQLHWSNHFIACKLRPAWV